MDESDLNNFGRGKFWIARNVLELPHDLQASCFSKLFAAFLCWRIICVHCRQAVKYDPNKRRPLSRFVGDFWVQIIWVRMRLFRAAFVFNGHLEVSKSQRMRLLFRVQVFYSPVYIPWAPKTMKNNGVGNLYPKKKTENVGLGGSWCMYIYIYMNKSKSSILSWWPRLSSCRCRKLRASSSDSALKHQNQKKSWKCKY